MMIHKNFARIFIILPIVFLDGAFAFAVDDFLIEPGIKIGRIQLGAQQSEVRQILGAPSGHYKAGTQTEADEWNSASSHNSLRVWYGPDGVIQISVTSPHFATRDGLSSESSLDRVQKSHPDTQLSNYFVHGSGGGLIRYYDDQKAGVTFEFTAPASDAPQFHPYAVLIDRPGKPVIPEPDETPRGR